MRKLLLFSLLGLTLSTQAQLKFTRTDSIIVKHGADTLDHAWAGGMNYCQFSSIDLDLDGVKDLFVFDRTNNQPLTFINKGGPGQIKYKYDPRFEKLFPNLISWVLLRDYNCDGKEDIFTFTPGGMAVYKNISDTALQFELVNPLLRGTQCTNFLNIFVSSVDIPSIEDVDYDGDLDILTFGVFGTFIEYHKNFSVEMGYGCDSLKFQMKNQCWGHFREDPSYCKIYLNQTQANCSALGAPEMGPYNPGTGEAGTITEDPERATRHTGSTMLAIDINGTNSKDLLVTDVTCKNVVLLTNSGTGPNLDSPMLSQDTAFPSYDVPVNLDLFPATFYVDINNDNKRDLVVSPNSTSLSDNTTGNLLYLNTGADNAPVFDFTQNGFLQKEMIERGEGALPVFFDHNRDGKMDLVVANNGFFNIADGSYIPRLGLYENIGTVTHPVYRLTNNDLASVYTAINKVALYPAFGDLDNDGDEDMIIGDFDGNLHRFTNTATSGAATFTLTTPLMTDNLGAIIDVGKYATPTLVDIDRDGDKDLIIGEQNATLTYYQNIGTASAPSFKFITDNLGGVDVSEYWTPIGHSVPAFYDNGGAYTLMVGSQTGVVYQYNNIDGNLGGTFTLIDSMNYENKVGGRTGVAIGHLNYDTRPDLIIGNFRGGLSLFFGTDNTTGFAENAAAENNLISVYPNPAQNTLYIRAQQQGRYRYSVVTVNGQQVISGQFSSNTETVNVTSLANGIYFLSVQDANGYRFNQRFVKHD